eukprot:66601_1
MAFNPAIINWYESRIHDSLNVDHWFNYAMNYWTMDQDKYGSSDDFSCNIKYMMLIPLVLSVSVLFMAVVMNIIIGHQYLRSNQIDIIGKIIMVYCWYLLEYDENSLLIRDQNILRPRAQFGISSSFCSSSFPSIINLYVLNCVVPESRKIEMHTQQY